MSLCAKLNNFRDDIELEKADEDVNVDGKGK